MDKKEQTLITGGSGFLGSALTGLLGEERYDDFTSISSHDCDLTDLSSVLNLFEEISPGIVFHLAAKVGGIQANQQHPAEFWLDNLKMGMNVLQACDYWRCKLILVGTTCSYPKMVTVPFLEENFWDGYPEETNAPYGIAKKTLMVGAQAFALERGLKVCLPVFSNLYGPGDNFDPQSSHVIPALIKRFHEAKEKSSPCVSVWGDGSATRDFLHVRDAARALLLCGDLDHPWPLNFGSGQERSISSLVHDVALTVGYHGSIAWDREKPNGQPRRLLDISKAKGFGWKPKEDFLHGLKETYDSYLMSLKIQKGG